MGSLAVVSEARLLGGLARGEPLLHLGSHRIALHRIALHCIDHESSYMQGEQPLKAAMSCS